MEMPVLHRTRTFRFYLLPSQRFWKHHLIPSGIFQRRNLDLAFRILNALRTTFSRIRVIDVGASVGMNSLHYSTKADEVVAFEPQKRVFQILTKNIKENGVDNIRAYPIALGEKQSRAKLVHFNPWHDGENYLEHTGEEIVGDDFEKELVRMATLDSFSEKFGAVHFVKIDVEGYELNVLRGGRRLLRTQKPAVQLEISRRHAR